MVSNYSRSAGFISVRVYLPVPSTAESRGPWASPEPSRGPVRLQDDLSVVWREDRSVARALDAAFARFVAVYGGKS